MQTVQVPCHIGHATIRTDRPILAVTMTIGSLLSIMISSIVELIEYHGVLGEPLAPRKSKSDSLRNSCQVAIKSFLSFGCRAWNSTITTTEWMRFSGGLLALEEGEE